MQHILDVGDLEPCEPMQRILDAIETLGSGDYLRVAHRREPHLLYPILNERGFDWRTYSRGTAGVELLIWKRSDRIAACAVADLVDSRDS